MTCDGWKTFIDHAATYQASVSQNFDVFKFDLKMPKLQNALEQQQVLVFHIHIPTYLRNIESKTINQTLIVVRKMHLKIVSV